MFSEALLVRSKRKERSRIAGGIAKGARLLSRATLSHCVTGCRATYTARHRAAQRIAYGSTDQCATGSSANAANHR
jgi:hypothetical protein